jgi:hypothetical protein
MPAILGGPSARRVWRKGQFSMSLQYLSEEPALFVWPQHRTLTRGAFVVPLGASWKYHPDKLSGEGEADRNQRAAAAIAQILHGLRAMGMEVDKRNAHEVYTLIADHLDDLILAKPDPGAEARGEKMVHRGEIAIRDGGRVIAEHEVRIPQSQAVAEALSGGDIQAPATLH